MVSSSQPSVLRPRILQRHLRRGQYLPVRYVRFGREGRISTSQTVFALIWWRITNAVTLICIHPPVISKHLLVSMPDKCNKSFIKVTFHPAYFGTFWGVGVHAASVNSCKFIPRFFQSIFNIDFVQCQGVMVRGLVSRWYGVRGDSGRCVVLHVTSGQLEPGVPDDRVSLQAQQLGVRWETLHYRRTRGGWKLGPCGKVICPAVN